MHFILKAQKLHLTDSSLSLAEIEETRSNA